MFTKQSIIGLLICLFSSIMSGQINNIIFIGGNGDGASLTCYQTISNNHIYAGGFFDGYQSKSITKVSHNFIFSGGHDDGSSMTCFVTPMNNSIFVGGNEDGSGQLCFQSISNSPIFNGGFEDGHSSTCYLVISSNPIFSGNFGDGYDSDGLLQMPNNLIFTGNVGDGYSSRQFLKLHNNLIFAGNVGDGYDKGMYTIHGPTLVWHGLYSSNWHFALNWDQNRIPNIEDRVIINTEKYDPILVKGKLGIGVQPSSFKEFGRDLTILEGSSLVFDLTTFAKIRSDLNIYGSLVSYNQTIYPVIEVLPAGRVTIFDRGLLYLLEQ